jgi:quinoprotein glucose dehydrogenase
MVALDLNRGDIAWTTPIGNGASRIRNHPLLKGLKLPPLGGAGAKGPLLTKTLLISAWDAEGPEEGEGPKLVAYDKATGKVLGAIDVPGNAIGTPMTYMLNGRQYIALTVDASPPELIALSLP